MDIRKWVGGTLGAGMVLAGLYLLIAAPGQTTNDRPQETQENAQPSLQPTFPQRTLTIPGSTVELQLPDLPDLPDLPELPPLPEDFGQSDGSGVLDSPRAFWSVGLIGLGAGLLTFAVSGRLTRRERAALQIRPREPGGAVENLGEMLLVEELLLLLTRDSGARFGVQNWYLDMALDAACELDIQEHHPALGTARLEPARAASPDAPPGKIPRAGHADRPPTRRLAALIERPSKGLRYAVFDELSRRAAGEDLSKTRARLRAKLENILIHGGTPNRHVTSLIALLSAVGVAPSWVVDPPDKRARGTINQHAAEILAGSPPAVRDVITDFVRRARVEARRHG